MSISRPVRGCLVGIGGYGAVHLRAFDVLEEAGLAKLTAVVVRNPAKYAEQVAALEERGVRCFTDTADALDARNFDFVAISTPLHLHRPMVVDALDAGIPVLCEKSAAPTVQDVQAMAAAAARTGVPLDIAYPMQSGSSVRALQRALLDGVVGRVSTVTVRAGWLRTEAYYQRSAWAGRVRLGGTWVLDGPVNNPHAHYLYAGMYFASSEPSRVANPVTVRGELYRARPSIEGEDTACIEAVFDNGVTERLYSTLATTDKTYASVRIDVAGDLGRVTWRSWAGKEPVKGVRKDGTAFEIEHDRKPGSTLRCIENFAHHLLGETDELVSPVSESVRFARVSNGAFDSSGTVRTVPAEYVDRCERPVKEREPDGERARVYELRDAVRTIDAAAAHGALFGDLGLPWAVKTAPLDVSDYRRFPQAFRTVDSA